MYEHVYVHACRGQKGVLDTLELVLLRLVSCSILEFYITAIVLTVGPFL